MSAFVHLNKLDLSHNRFISIPTQLGKLPNLQTLNLSYNAELNDYSENIKSLNSIKLVNLKGTALNDFQLHHINDMLMACNVIY